MPRSPSPSEPCSSSGETLERSRCRGQLGAGSDPGGASRTGQATGLADRRGAVPKAQLGGAGVLPRQFLPWSSWAAVDLGRVGVHRVAAHDRVRRRPDPRRWPARGPGPRPLAASARSAGAGRADRRARAVQPPSRALGVACGASWATGRRGGRWATSLAKVPLTLFGVWFALSIWIEALFGIAIAADRWPWHRRVSAFWAGCRARASTADRQPGPRSTSARS